MSDETGFHTEAWQRKPVRDIRVAPCTDAHSVWVEVVPPFNWERGKGIEMTPELALELAEQLASAVRRALAWKGGSY